MFFVLFCFVLRKVKATEPKNRTLGSHYGGKPRRQDLHFLMSSLIPLMPLDESFSLLGFSFLVCKMEILTCELSPLMISL